MRQETNLRAWKAYGWGLAVFAVAVDQISKFLIIQIFSDSVQPYYGITPFFNIVLAWNRGVSFGLFGGAGENGPLILIGLTLVIIGGLAVWLVKAETRFSAVGLGLIIGGALGNVIDRFRFGAVTDFLDLYVMGYHWPAFNFADSFVVVGAAALLLESFFVSDESSPGSDETH